MEYADIFADSMTTQVFFVLSAVLMIAGPLTAVVWSMVSERHSAPSHQGLRGLSPQHS